MGYGEDPHVQTVFMLIWVCVAVPECCGVLCSEVLGPEKCHVKILVLGPPTHDFLKIYLFIVFPGSLEYLKNCFVGEKNTNIPEFLQTNTKTVMG